MADLVEVVVDPVEEDVLEVSETGIGKRDQLQVSVAEQFAPDLRGSLACALVGAFVELRPDSPSLADTKSRSLQQCTSAATANEPRQPSRAISQTKTTGETAAPTTNPR